MALFFCNNTLHIPVIVLSIFFLYNKIFQQSELQVTFPFQPEENTAIWATISGNAILNHSFVCMNIQNQNQDQNQVIGSHIMYRHALPKHTYRRIITNGKWV